MRKSKGLIKTLKLVPNEVSHRNALEGSQALSSQRCLFPDRVPATPWAPPPTHPAFGGQVAPRHQRPARQAWEHGVRGHAGGGCAAQHLRCPWAPQGGQVSPRMRCGQAGGQLSAASLARVELLVCENPLMQGTAHRGRGPGIGPAPSHPLRHPEPPRLFSLVAFLTPVSLSVPSS